MYSKIKNLSRKKKVILVALVLLISIPFYNYISIDSINYRKWDVLEKELNGMEGFYIKKHSNNFIPQLVLSLPIPAPLKTILIKPTDIRSGIFCENITLSNDYFKKIPPSDNFIQICLCDTGITDEVVPYLLKYPNLQELQLINCDINGLQFHYLAQLKKLKQIELGGTNVDDFAINGIANLPVLKHLGLANTPITDKCIPHLIKLKSLLTLIVEGTKLTDEGVKELKSKMPKCNIYY